MPDIFAENPHFAELDAADDGVFGSRADFLATYYPTHNAERQRQIDLYLSGEIHRTRAENTKNRSSGWGPEVVCGTCGRDVHTRADGQPRKHRCDPIDNPEAIVHQSHPDLLAMDRRITATLHTARGRLDAELVRVDAMITAAANPAMRTVTKAYRVGVAAALDDIIHMSVWHREHPEEGTLPGLAELQTGTDGNSPGPLRAVNKMAISGYEHGIALAVGALIAAAEGA
ncbi:hypothetical protein [Frankia tisae]|uniref:hypothetical protein n=1 Tax=Frankia tisae TaxID=2950104 RepID=UPI0021BF67E1|nr:hypothetical protein [Frankia tisae]